MKFKYPLADSSWDNAEFSALEAVIKSGKFTMGAHVAKFERQMEQYLNAKHCVMVNSGSSANLLMVAALFYTKNPRYKCNRGDEVIVPAVSWSTTYFPLLQYGLKLKFVDIDLETLNYDLTALSDAVSNKTRIIFAVNLLGNPNDFDRIFQIIDGRPILLLEDNCESLGAQFGNQKTGTLGLMGSYSTFFSHHISTMEGGVVSTNDEELLHILLSLRAHGWTRDLPKVNQVCSNKADDSFFESYRFVLPGYNLRPTELSGAVGVEQLKKLPDMINIRRENARALKKILGDSKDLMIQKEIGESSWFGFSLIIRPGSKISRAYLRKRLSDLGFEVRPIVAGNFAKNEAINYFDYEISNSLRNADYLHDNGVFIGNHHYSLTSSLADLSKI